jgi:hypothetical protein
MTARTFTFRTVAALACCALGACQAEPSATSPSPAGDLTSLEFEGDYPTAETTANLDRYQDFSFATSIVFWAQPFMESALFNEVISRDFGVENNTAFIFDQRVRPGQEMPLTPNQSVVYMVAVIDLSEGPIVLEVAPNVLAAFYDMWQRGTEDPGILGPDQGAGGSYLALPPGYEGEVPEGYFVIRAHGLLNYFLQRGYVTTDFTQAQATEHLLTNTRIYPLEEAGERPDLVYTRMGTEPVRQNRPTGMAWWRMLKTSLDREVVDPRDRSMYGFLAALGIQKGRPFEPDDRLTQVLIEAERVGTSMVANNSWNFRAERIGMEAQRWPGQRRWENIFFFDGIQENESYTPVFERGFFTWQAWGMQKFWKPDEVVLGRSTTAILASRDGTGAYLNGSNTYGLHVPANVPVANFWALTVYDVRTRGVLENESGEFEVSSASGGFETNPDGSVDLYVAPELPEGVPESNWIQSVRDRGWFTYFRFYGVLEGFVSGEWVLDDFERTE